MEESWVGPAEARSPKPGESALSPDRFDTEEEFSDPEDFLDDISDSGEFVSSGSAIRPVRSGPGGAHGGADSTGMCSQSRWLFTLLDVR